MKTTTLKITVTEGALERLQLAAAAVGEPVEVFAARLLTADPIRFGAGQISPASVMAAPHTASRMMTMELGRRAGRTLAAKAMAKIKDR